MLLATGWTIGFWIGSIVVLAVVALVVPILMLARSIGNRAADINASLEQSVTNTAALAGLQTTIDSASAITAQVKRDEFLAHHHEVTAGEIDRYLTLF